MRKWIALVAVLAFASCEYFVGPEGDQGPVGPAGPPGEIEYWEHTIAGSETSYSSTVGTYSVIIRDDRFELNAWYDFYLVYDDDYWIPINTWFDAVTMIWFDNIMIGDGSIGWFSLGDQVGETIVIFKAPAEFATKGFDARQFFPEWPPKR